MASEYIKKIRTESGDKQIDYLALANLPTIPSKMSEIEFDVKPAYTPTEVGADAKGTAENKISEHNVATEAHNDIRLQIQEISTHLNTALNSNDVDLDQLSEIVAYIKNNKTLIEGVTTSKVSVSDIVDNLETNVFNKPLSAKQGTLLRTMIEAIVVPTKVSQLTNDKNFVDSNTSTLTNYYNTADIDNKFNQIGGSVEIVSGNPTKENTVITIDPDSSEEVKLYTVSEVDSLIKKVESKIPNIPVKSVNGKTGDIELNATDVGAATKTWVNSQITYLKSQGIQQVPLFANDVSECADTEKFYVLPDGFIYAYMKTIISGGVSYTNLVPKSTDTDGSIYNGVGYKDNARLSSSGGVSGTAQAGSVVTGFIPYSSLGIIRIKGATWAGIAAAEGHYYINAYDSTKNCLSGVSSAGYTNGDFVGMSAVYDSATGVTTIDFSGMSSGNATRANFEKAAFIRLNAKGVGTDLIVTVNEEIKEAASTESYAWTNTGRAFVPADYEDRIVELEGVTEEHESDIKKLKGDVDSILNGNTDIVASTKFDPTVYDLPILYLVGDTSPIAVSKDNKVTLDYIYGERAGTCTLKGQGATSYKMAKAFIDAGRAGKFNYTIKFDTAFEVVEGWGTQQKYCLKANWIDHTHSRNVVSCKLWGMSVKDRSTVPTELANLPNGGAIDGFPIIIMLNGEFHGLYTWNIPKDGWMFGLVEDAAKTQAIVGADDHTAATQFKEASMTGFEVEFVSDEDNASWVETSLTRMISAVMNSNGSDLDTTVAQYLDLDSVIDHFIHTVVDKATDCVDKNYLLVTFDGTKWYMSAYDRDSIHGLNWDGSGTTRPVSNVSFLECAATVKIYELIKNYKTATLKSRYNHLRGNILSESRIMEKFENFAWAIPSTVLAEDVKKYPTIRGSSVNTIDQIGRWVRQRLETCDKWIEEL